MVSCCDVDKCSISLKNKAYKDLSEEDIDQLDKEKADEADEGHTKLVRICLIYPDAWLSYFYLAWMLMSIFCFILTLNSGSFEWDDNIIYNKFGFNSYCIIFDYEPSIFFGPGLWVLCCIFGMGHTIFQWLRMEIIDIAEKKQDIWITDREHNIFTAFTIVELLNYCMFSTVFAVNDEHINIHIVPFVCLIVVFCLGSLKNLWFMWRVSGIDGWRLNFYIVFCVLYCVSGGVMAPCSFVYTFWESSCNVGPTFDTTWTLLTLVHWPISVYVVGDDLGVIQLKGRVMGLKSLGIEARKSNDSIKHLVSVYDENTIEEQNNEGGSKPAVELAVMNEKEEWVEVMADGQKYWVQKGNLTTSIPGVHD